MEQVLGVMQNPEKTTSIIRKEYHSYLPFIQSFGNNDEIRIAI